MDIERKSLVRLGESTTYSIGNGGQWQSHLADVRRCSRAALAATDSN